MTIKVGEETYYSEEYVKELKEENNNLKEDFKRHIDRINELTERNEKAIEYINSKHNWYGDEEEDNEDYLFELEDFEELLDILKGDNK